MIDTFTPAMKANILALLKEIGGDGHTIYAAKILKNFPDGIRKRFMKTHKSRGGKYDISTDAGKVDKLEGIYGLCVLDAICEDLDLPTSSKTGRGFRAQENTATIIAFLESYEEQPCQNQHGYFCPQCGESDEITISVSATAHLYPDGLDVSDSGTEWEDSSDAGCNNCNWTGQVKDLHVDESRIEEE